MMAPATRLDTGQRYVEVRKQRTKRDYAEFMQQLLSTHYPQIHQLHMLQDTLNTHQAGSFYDRFDAVTAHELANRFVFHYTPTHASWLNMAEPGGQSHRVCGLIQTVSRPANWELAYFRERSTGMDERAQPRSDQD